MTTVAPDGISQDELDRLAHDAWSTYADHLRGLEGADYDAAEGREWDVLQETLADIEARRVKAADATSPSTS
jgi:hypothetical protein